MQENQLPELYATHIKAVREEIEQLSNRRSQALAAVHEIEEKVRTLNYHVTELLKLQMKEQKLDGQYKLTDDMKLVEVSQQKINGLDHA